MVILTRSTVKRAGIAATDHVACHLLPPAPSSSAPADSTCTNRLGSLTRNEQQTLIVNQRDRLQ